MTAPGPEPLPDDVAGGDLPGYRQSRFPLPSEPVPLLAEAHSPQVAGVRAPTPERVGPPVAPAPAAASEAALPPPVPALVPAPGDDGEARSRDSVTGTVGAGPAAAVVRGHLEAVVSGQFAGWASVSVDGVSGSVPRVRVVAAGGAVIAEGQAGDFRQDVLDAGLGSGWCGFDLRAGPAALAGVSAVVLEVRTPQGWVAVAQHEVAEQPVEEVSLRPRSLLAAFADADGHTGVVGRTGLTFGSGVWLQAASKAVDRVTASLHLAAAEAGATVPVLRLQPDGQVEGQVEVRLSLGAHTSSVRGGWLTVKVYGRSGVQQRVKLRLRDHTGRSGLGDFVVPSHRWSTLQVLVPRHRCSDPAAGGEGGALWLELEVDAAVPLDVAAPELMTPADQDDFECPHVQRQQGLLDTVRDRPAQAATAFTVVIPFYGKAAYTAACVNSVLASSWAPPEVVLVDDGSPNAGSVQRLLDHFDQPVRVLRVPQNRGYTASVNAGVRAAAHEVVVVLNNDTRVTPGWDAPLRLALEDPSVFAAGPLSNAASYQSVPDQRAGGAWAVNSLPPGVSPTALADELRRQLHGRQLPLAVLNGFCYAVRAADFLRLGGLDEQAFPEGYGEETDLMLRAQKAGLRTVVTPDSFVYHYKSVTFGAKRADLSKRGYGVLQDRWGGALAEAVRTMDDDPAFDEVRGTVRHLVADLAVAAGRVHG